MYVPLSPSWSFGSSLAHASIVSTLHLCEPLFCQHLAMFKRNSPKVRVMPSITHMTPVSTAAGADVVSNKGSIVAIDAAQESVQATRKSPNANLLHMIDQKTWEHAELTRDLALLKRKHAATVYLCNEVEVVVKNLQQTLANFQDLTAELQDDAAGGKR
jgi:hypothetical protein